MSLFASITSSILLITLPFFETIGNYVSEYKTQTPTDVVRPVEEIQAFRSVVYNDLLESERAHCAELRGLLENFLEPLETSQM